ncbi:BREX system Lon protease-like protein BrxL [Persicobacter sp. CCB-QB2]|uniref:BREX system Lon protease-like protein BrxL n=1 Tax=Persicobacter sp. CCB-QB2 TaxID=1561025 RepID=UPI0006A944F0|nr:BREX system Lon protease-like protein BrxL [Persicobacter sp. CCB-QB2]
MSIINEKLNKFFEGKVVRKDLTKKVKGNAIVPTYVLEYLLGQYCATNDEATIEGGVETVKNIISRHFVHRDEAQIIKSTIREQGSHRIIDKISVKLNDKKDQYEAFFANLGLNGVPIGDEIIKANQKLLSGGVWCILTMGYLATDEKGTNPWIVENLKPIQIPEADIEEYKKAREHFSRIEWIDALMQSIGLNPKEFSFRSKLIQLCRLIPYVENNYNLIELGPKGTGKSHIFSEMSPHGILISGGEVSKAKLFVNNSNGEIGLVGYWDVVAYDEFAGKTKKVDRGLVDIMKNYMANKSFSRGTNVYSAAASMVFVGNTDRSVPYMLKHSNLFEALPKDYYDTAFLDRMHGYLPGWEVDKLRNEMFTSDFGFIVDYLAEVLKGLRKEDFSHSYEQYFQLSNSITTRDKTAIAKTFSGLVKIIFPNGEFTEEEGKELLDFAIENRRRVKEQLRKMDETFEEVDFSYTINSSESKQKVITLEEIEYQNTHTSTVEKKTPADVPAPKTKDLPSAPSVEDAESKPLFEGEKQIFENQRGISYQGLFKEYLIGASEIILQDPYIRTPHQIKNLMEFISLLFEVKTPDQEIKFKLITNNKAEYLSSSVNNFEDIQDQLKRTGISFEFEFNETMHDRSLTMNNGWRIVLGRGLDIFQSSQNSNRFDLGIFVPTQRLCRQCSIIYIKEKKIPITTI